MRAKTSDSISLYSSQRNARLKSLRALARRRTAGTRQQSRRPGDTDGQGGRTPWAHGLVWPYDRRRPGVGDDCTNLIVKVSFLNLRPSSTKTQGTARSCIAFDLHKELVQLNLDAVSSSAKPMPQNPRSRSDQRINENGNVSCFHSSSNNMQPSITMQCLPSPASGGRRQMPSLYNLKLVAGRVIAYAVLVIRRTLGNTKISPSFSGNIAIN